MTVSDIIELLSCEVFTGREETRLIEIRYGCASDLMSDVLAFSRTGAVLLTGLVNIQTIHTAFIAEISAIVCVRGKRPGNDVIAMADTRGIPLLGTNYSMYEASGILYGRGLVSTMQAGKAKNRFSSV